MLGSAAIRSISAIIARRRPGGAYSEMNRAMASAAGTAITSEMMAMMVPSIRTAPTPMWLPYNRHSKFVRNRQPTWCSTPAAFRTRNKAISPVMTSTAKPAAYSTPWNTLSAGLDGALMGRGLWAIWTRVGVSGALLTTLRSPVSLRPVPCVSPGLVLLMSPPLGWCRRCGSRSGDEYSADQAGGQARQRPDPPGERGPPAGDTEHVNGRAAEQQNPPHDQQDRQDEPAQARRVGVAHRVRGVAAPTDPHRWGRLGPARRPVTRRASATRPRAPRAAGAARAGWRGRGFGVT